MCTCNREGERMGENRRGGIDEREGEHVDERQEENNGWV